MWGVKKSHFGSRLGSPQFCRSLSGRSSSWVRLQLSRPAPGSRRPGEAAWACGDRPLLRPPGGRPFALPGRFRALAPTVLVLFERAVPVATRRSSLGERFPPVPLYKSKGEASFHQARALRPRVDGRAGADHGCCGDMASHGSGRWQGALGRSRSRAEGDDAGASTLPTASTELRGEGVVPAPECSLVARFTAKFAARLAERLGSVQSDFVAHIGTTSAEYDDAAQRRFCDIDPRAARHEERSIGAVEVRDVEAEKRLVQLGREFRFVASWEVRRVDVDEDWGRTPPPPCSSGQCRRAHRDGEDRAARRGLDGLRRHHRRSRTKNTSVAMAGAHQTAACGARAALAALRAPGRTWRRMPITALAGHKAQVYFGEDCSPQQQKVEARLRRTQRAMSTAHPRLGEGTLSIGLQRLLRVEAPIREWTWISWNSELVAQQAIDKADVCLNAPAGGADNAW